MNDNDKTAKSTRPESLNDELMNPSNPKNELAWFAYRKVKSLEDVNAALTLDIGLLKIAKNQNNELLESCEGTLSKRDVENEALKDRVKELEVNRRISVEDRLPEKGVDVLIYPPIKHWNESFIYTARLIKEGVYENWVYYQENSSYRNSDITHWEPLTINKGE